MTHNCWKHYMRSREKVGSLSFEWLTFRQFDYPKYLTTLELETQVKLAKSLQKEKMKLESELSALNSGIAKAQVNIEMAEEKLKLIDESEMEIEMQLNCVEITNP